VSIWVEWLLSIVGIVVVVIAGIAITVRVQMGPLNFPPVSGTFEPGVL